MLGKSDIYHRSTFDQGIFLRPAFHRAILYIIPKVSLKISQVLARAQIHAFLHEDFWEFRSDLEKIFLSPHTTHHYYESLKAPFKKASANDAEYREASDDPSLQNQSKKLVHRNFAFLSDKTLDDDWSYLRIL